MVLRAVLSHYRRHPLQLAALWLILGLATALWSGVWTLTQQARDSMLAGDAQLGGRQQVVRTDGTPVSQQDFVTLRRQGLCVLPWLEVTPEDSRGRVVGIDVLAMACGGTTSQGGGGDLDGKPFIDIGEAAALANSGHPARFRLYFAGPEQTARTLPHGWQLRAEPGQLETGELTDSFLLNLDALGVLVVLVAALLIRSVYSLGLAQRRQSLALLDRYGVARHRVQRILLGELLVMGVLGAVPGYLLGLALADFLASGFGKALDSLFGTTLLASGGHLRGFLVTLVMVALVLFWCGLDLVRGGSDPWLKERHRIMAALLGMVAGGGLVLLSGHLFWLFTGTGLLLLSSALITPLLMARYPQAAAHRLPMTLWRRRETGVLVRRLGLPLVALQLAAATVIAVQALVTTFEDTFQQWLGQRLAGDLFVEVPEGQGFGQVAEILNGHPAVAGWHPVLQGQVSADLSVGSGEARPVAAMDLMATDTRSEMIRQWSLLASSANPWQGLAEGRVLINEQLARRQQLGPGDAVSLRFPQHQVEARVAGVYADYGRPSGEVLMDHSLLPSSFTPAFQSLTIALMPEATADQRASLEADLHAAWQVGELAIRDNQTIEQLATQLFEQTFTLTRAISLLTLGLAGASLLITGWVVLRSRAWYYQLLSVWGLGSWRRLRVVISLAVGLLVRVWLAALPLGALLTWILVARINPTAFGWSLPMAVYPLYWLELLALLLVAGVAIGWVAGRREGVAPVASPLNRGGLER